MAPNSTAPEPGHVVPDRKIGVSGSGQRRKFRTSLVHRRILLIPNVPAPTHGGNGGTTDCPARSGSGWFSRGAAMRFAVYYRDVGTWAWSDTPPWDSRPTADNIWAAFTAAEWASQQKLDWSHRERVFEVLKKKDAEVACRGGLERLTTRRGAP